MEVNTPGEAMRVAQAVLRHHGYSIDQVEAWHDEGEYFKVSGLLVDDDLATAGRFVASVTEAGTYKIAGGPLGGSMKIIAEEL